MSTKTFDANAPWLMEKLKNDFQFSTLDAAAIVGNAGHESGGFELLQELKPVVAGSRGGYGYMQWTGPRRRAFEAYVERNKLDIKSKEANYAWLWNELTGSEKAAVAKTKAAKTLEDKTKVFCDSFLRPGTPHYTSRNKWAREALGLYTKAAPTPKAPEKPVEPPTSTPVTVPSEKPESLWVKLLRLLTALLTKR